MKPPASTRTATRSRSARPPARATVKLYICAEDTAELGVGTAVYDVEMVTTVVNLDGDEESYVYRAWQGTVTLHREVTR